MLYSLRTETKLDIFKFLGYEEVCSTKQTNLYFYNFINKYGELACEKIFEISIWRNGLENPIPLYLPVLNSDRIYIWLSKVCKSGVKTIILQLPAIIRSVNDIKIVYYYLNKFFKFYFTRGNFGGYIFNPELIQILFEEKQFHIENAGLFLDCSIEEKFIFIWKHLHINYLSIKFSLDKDAREYTDILYKILMNGKMLTKLYLTAFNLQEFLEIILNLIETSEDFSKMVANIRLTSVINFVGLEDRAEETEEEYVVEYFSLIKYNLRNKFMPQIEFSIDYDTNSHRQFQDVLDPQKLS
uniref:Uncharacterized protein n=1 Tax=Meloidogyne enterolobii TaxID=390850 RepID=A0A6V7V8S4_MELEN|nr:unnamed protein product [Meloidogyne enterolobii]